MRGLERRRQLGLIDREPVVLARDEYASGLELLHRVVRAVVSEFHLHRARAAREAEQLVAEADAEGRQVGDDQRAYRLDGVFTRLRISGAVRQEQSIRL